MSDNKDRDDGVVYDNKVMIKNCPFGSFFDKELRGLVSFVYVLFRSADEKTFPTLWYLHKSFMYHIKAVRAVERFHIVTHSYPASLSIKTCLDKTNNIF